jgi:hypothetical protein
MAPEPVPWLLWRQNLQNFFRSINPVESAALAAALSGGNFAQLCEELGVLLPQVEIPAAAASLLGSWADSGVIVKVGSSNSDASQ